MEVDYATIYSNDKHFLCYICLLAKKAQRSDLHRHSPLGKADMPLLHHLRIILCQSLQADSINRLQYRTDSAMSARAFSRCSICRCGVVSTISAVRVMSRSALVNSL